MTFSEQIASLQQAISGSFERLYNKLVAMVRGRCIVYTVATTSPSSITLPDDPSIMYVEFVGTSSKNITLTIPERASPIFVVSKLPDSLGKKITIRSASYVTGSTVVEIGKYSIYNNYASVIAVNGNVISSTSPIRNVAITGDVITKSSGVGADGTYTLSTSVPEMSLRTGGIYTVSYAVNETVKSLTEDELNVESIVANVNIGASPAGSVEKSLIIPDSHKRTIRFVNDSDANIRLMAVSSNVPLIIPYRETVYVSINHLGNPVAIHNGVDISGAVIKGSRSAFSVTGKSGYYYLTKDESNCSILHLSGTINTGATVVIVIDAKRARSIMQIYNYTTHQLDTTPTGKIYIRLSNNPDSIDTHSNDLLVSRYGGQYTAVINPAVGVIEDGNTNGVYIRPELQSGTCSSPSTTDDYSTNIVNSKWLGDRLAGNTLYYEFTVDSSNVWSPTISDLRYVNSVVVSGTIDRDTRLKLPAGLDKPLVIKNGLARSAYDFIIRASGNSSTLTAAGTSDIVIPYNNVVMIQPYTTSVKSITTLTPSHTSVSVTGSTLYTLNRETGLIIVSGELSDNFTINIPLGYVKQTVSLYIVVTRPSGATTSKSIYIKTMDGSTTINTRSFTIPVIPRIIYKVISINSDGLMYIDNETTDTPAATDNSYSIANTKWVWEKFLSQRTAVTPIANQIVTLTDTQYISGNLSISNTAMVNGNVAIIKLKPEHDGKVLAIYNDNDLGSVYVRGPDNASTSVSATAGDLLLPYGKWQLIVGNGSSVYLIAGTMAQRDFLYGTTAPASTAGDNGDIYFKY